MNEDINEVVIGLVECAQEQQKTIQEAINGLQKSTSNLMRELPERLVKETRQIATKTARESVYEVMKPFGEENKKLGEAMAAQAKAAETERQAQADRHFYSHWLLLGFLVISVVTYLFNTVWPHRDLIRERNAIRREIADGMEVLDFIKAETWGIVFVTGEDGRRWIKLDKGDKVGPTVKWTTGEGEEGIEILKK